MGLIPILGKVFFFPQKKELNCLRRHNMLLHGGCRRPVGAHRRARARDYGVPVVF